MLTLAILMRIEGEGSQLELGVDFQQILDILKGREPANYTHYSFTKPYNVNLF